MDDLRKCNSSVCDGGNYDLLNLAHSDVKADTKLPHQQEEGYYLMVFPRAMAQLHLVNLMQLSEHTQ
ncbi:MAG: hypothetical protein IPO98_13465 [Saprospiraceae bacterium]|nr:hypothetical protein [Saprospiraceae bacterium]